jgi:glycosyltransferase involved in cell wall biosynthesis
MRIAHIVNSLTKASGVSAFCSNMVQHLANQGIDIDLYVWWVGDDALLPDHERIRIIETKDTGFNPDIRPDIVHVHSLWVPIAHQGCVYARRNKVPYIISPHGMLTSWALKHNWWKKLFGMAFYQYRDLKTALMLHVTAPSEADDISRLKLSQNIALVPLGTILPEPDVEVSDNIHEGEQPGSRIILFLSRLDKKKGLVNLFHAWASVRRDWIAERQQTDRHCPVRWRLVIAGPGAMGYKEELLSLARSLRLNCCDLSDNFHLSCLDQIEKDTDVVFTGPVYGKDKDGLHRIADLLVLPSFTENFGAVVIDSLAHSVPVITTKGTPWKELEGQKEAGSEKSSGRCGWWIDIGVEPLAKALREAMKMTDEERRKMGENGRRLVEAKYTWPIVAGEMKKAYEGMLGGT